MKIIKSLFFLSLFLYANQMFSQNFVLKYGKQLSSFSYIDSENNTLDNLHQIATDFQSIGYQTCLYKDILDASFGINFSDYGSIGSDDSVHNYMEWKTTYLGAFLDIDAQIFQIKEMQANLNIGFSSEYLVRGTQTLNNQVFDLTQDNNYNKMAYFYKAGLSLSYPISQRAKIILQYQLGKSLNISDINEKFNISFHQFGMGVKINLNFKNENNEK
jgi:hypothetical protein